MKDFQLIQPKNISAYNCHCQRSCDLIGSFLVIIEKTLYKRMSFELYSYFDFFFHFPCCINSLFEMEIMKIPQPKIKQQ